MNDVTDYQIDDAVRFTVVDGEAIVVQQRTGEVITLNRTATVLLEELERGAGLDGAISRIGERYAMDGPAVRDDVTRCCFSLEEAGILVKAG